MSLRDGLRKAISDPGYPWHREFSSWAKRVFEHQFQGCEPYRNFCEGRGVTPQSLGHWREIPAVPTDVFKYVELFAGTEKNHVFRTSGTTTDARGQHVFSSTDVYEAALAMPFERWCLSDAASIPMAILAPHPDDLTDSSLSFMLGKLVDHFGAEGSRFFFEAADGEFHFDIEGLRDWIEAADSPVMLLGTAFAFVEFLDASESLELPAGSRIMETGGTKGRTREVTREEFYEMLQAGLGLSATSIISEYSMTELSSQAYTDTFARERHWKDAAFEVPAWVRVEVVDPITLEPLKEPGVEGLIRWYDLANLDSVLAVQTSDVGIKEMEGGFKLLGRAKGAELRGCSLTIEEILD